jgi:hypothetical protein
VPSACYFPPLLLDPAASPPLTLVPPLSWPGLLPPPTPLTPLPIAPPGLARFGVVDVAESVPGTPVTVAPEVEVLGTEGEATLADPCA